MSRTHSALVGAYHRPPAPALIKHLPNGAPLRLEREPHNQFDPFAVKVWARSATIPEGQYPSLDAAAQGYGFTIENILAQSEWHLGYLAAKPAKGVDGALAAQIAPRLDATAGYSARLVFDGAGRPIVEIEWTSQQH